MTHCSTSISQFALVTRLCAGGSRFPRGSLCTGPTEAARSDLSQTKADGGSNVMTWGTRTWKFNIGLENVSPFNVAILDMFDCRDVNQSYYTTSFQEASLMVIDSRSMFFWRGKNHLNHHFVPAGSTWKPKTHHLEVATITKPPAFSCWFFRKVIIKPIAWWFHILSVSHFPNEDFLEKGCLCVFFFGGPGCPMN